ncbi:MAG TPA: universal stress protein, partial [Solirubrobacteraceae bacterium]|nr:universal stress protein [Solirubrobacteraceae bacterium]
PLPHIPHDPITFGRPDALEEALRGAQADLRASLTRELTALAASVVDAAPGLPVETSVLDGHPADRLVAQADGDGGLIVVGSRGYGPLGAVLVGSVAAEVLREATSPVIVVPRSA